MAKILIVEDDTLLAEFVEFLLQQEGYTTVGAADGDVVLHTVRQEQPDLVLLDVMLPNVDGFEVLRRIKDVPDLKHTPVIMFTARSRDADIALAFEMGASDYVEKPFNPTELLVRVRKVLRDSDVGSPRSR